MATKFVDEIPEICKECAGSICGCSYDPEACTGFMSVKEYYEMFDDIEV